MEKDYEANANTAVNSSYVYSDAASNKSTTPLEGAKKTSISLAGKIAIGILAATVSILVVGLPIVDIAVGSVFINQCPIDSRIPIYLIAKGSLGLILLIFVFSKIVREKSVCLSIILGILVLVFVACFITGSVWLFVAKRSVQYYNEGFSWNYCNYSLFNYAYYMNIIYFGMYTGLAYQALKS